MPIGDMFWGDRYGQLRDPFGVLWSMGAPISAGSIVGQVPTAALSVARAASAQLPQRP